MAQPNYSFQKRQKELAKKKKNEEKLLRKQQQKNGGTDAEAPAAEDGAPDDGPAA